MSGPRPTRDEFLAQVTAALEARVGSALVQSSTFDIERLTPRSNDPAMGAEFVVHVRTADPQRLLRQFVPFSDQGLGGFSEHFVRGWIAARFPTDTYGPIRFHLDVARDPALGEPEPLYQVLPIGDSRVQTILARDPDHARHLQEFRPRAAMLSGEIISGPSIAMMHALRRLLERRLPCASLDGCAGSATLALLSLRAGVPRVTSVDSAEFPSVSNIMSDHSSRWRYEVADLVDYLARHPPDAFDLITVDAFYGDILRLLSRLSALEYLPRARFLLNGGPSVLTNWHSQVAAAMQRVFPEVSWHDMHKERIYVASGLTGQ